MRGQHLQRELRRRCLPLVSGQNVDVFGALRQHVSCGIAQDHADSARALFVDRQHRRRVEHQSRHLAGWSACARRGREIPLGGPPCDPAALTTSTSTTALVNSLAGVVDGDVVDDRHPAVRHRVAQVGDRMYFDARRIGRRRVGDGGPVGSRRLARNLPAVRWCTSGAAVRPAASSRGQARTRLSVVRPELAAASAPTARSSSSTVSIARYASAAVNCLVVGPLVADIAQLACVVLRLPRQMPAERIAKVAEPFGHRAQHQRQVTAPVHSDRGVRLQCLCGEEVRSTPCPVAALLQTLARRTASSRR